MEYAAHLPLMDFGGNPYSIEHLVAYAETAERLGFKALSANDHLVFSVPWLDGPTALAAVLAHSGNMDLMTTVALPVVRGPIPLAKSLGAIDRLSGGRMIVAVGPGSFAKDYAAVGIAFEERWKRLDEAIQALRALWRKDSEPFQGNFYTTEEIDLQPYPAQPTGPPIWVGSWGSDAGMRRTARLGDGWLASAYNTTPELFIEARSRLQDYLREYGRDVDPFPNALSTMWFYISEDGSETERIWQERLFPTINRPESDLRERLPIGPAEAFAEKLAAFRSAGVQRVFIWPVADEVRQLTLFHEKVIPLLRS
jgi:probable F420-dependent oxidoreductase